MVIKDWERLLLWDRNTKIDELFSLLKKNTVQPSLLMGDQCSSLLWVTLAHAPGKKATHKHWLPQRQLEKSERVLVFCWVFLFVFWGFCLFFGGELLFIVTYCCGHVVEGGFQQIKILVYIRIHWLQADEVIQKVIHLSNIEQSDKNLLHYHVLISNITKACVWQ